MPKNGSDAWWSWLRSTLTPDQVAALDKPIPKGRISAQDWHEHLLGDPEYLALKGEMERRRWQETASLRLAEEPLVSELRAAGFNVTSVWDLANTPLRYDAAIPILLAHFGRQYPDEILGGIARALGVKEAQPFWPQVARRYREVDGTKFPITKEGLAASISRLAAPQNLPEVVELISDPSNGESRILLVEVLSRSRQQLAKETLEKLSTDPDLRMEIARKRDTAGRRAKNRPRSQ